MSLSSWHSIRRCSAGAGWRWLIVVVGCLCLGCPHYAGGPGGTPGPGTAHLPNLPWPLPRATAFLSTRRNQILKADRGRFGDAIDQLGRALARAGYEPRWYLVGDTNLRGFAALTPIEQIHEDGQALPGRERWSTALPSWGTSLFDYLRALVLPVHGHYRVFFVVVTSLPFTFAPDAPAEKQLGTLIDGGAGDIGRFIGDQQYDDMYALGVYVYEFQSASADVPAAFVPSTAARLSATDHLRSAGLLPSLGDSS